MGAPSRLFPTLQITPASTKIPQPASVLVEPAGQVNILILGSDPLPNNGGYSTDILLLLTLRPDNTVNITSFPRDLYLYIPGWSMQRISLSQTHGGIGLTAMTFDYNFGFKPEYYIMTDLSGFPAIVDALGGLDVQVAKSFHAPRPGFTNGYSVQPGKVHMNGATALWYTRVLTTAGESDRIRRSQEVVVAIGLRLVSTDAVERIPELYNQLQKYATTNLTLEDLLELLPRYLDVKPDKVKQFMIGASQVLPWTEPVSKTKYLLPLPEAIRQVLQQAVGIP
jgi:LCP family protein required for cell wall assembly